MPCVGVLGFRVGTFADQIVSATSTRLNIMAIISAVRPRRMTKPSIWAPPSGQRALILRLGPRSTLPNAAPTITAFRPLSLRDFPGSALVHFQRTSGLTPVVRGVSAVVSGHHQLGVSLRRNSPRVPACEPLAQLARILHWPRHQPLAPCLKTSSANSAASSRIIWRLLS